MFGEADAEPFRSEATGAADLPQRCKIQECNIAWLHCCILAPLKKV
jgi:hypothetical protein